VVAGWLHYVYVLLHKDVMQPSYYRDKVVMIMLGLDVERVCAAAVWTVECMRRVCRIGTRARE